MSWYLAVLKNYATFSGRARRTEYWMFVLFHALAMFLLMIIAIAGALAVHTATDGSPLGMLFLAPYILYSLAMVIPTYAVIVRRLHDTGRSGLWLLMILVPGGSIVLLVFMCLDGQPHDNQYGPSPKGLTYPYGYGPFGPVVAGAQPGPYGGASSGAYPGHVPGGQPGMYAPPPGGYAGAPAPQPGGYPPPQPGAYPPPQSGSYPPPQPGGYPPNSPGAQPGPGTS